MGGERPTRWVLERGIHTISFSAKGVSCLPVSEGEVAYCLNSYLCFLFATLGGLVVD